VLGGRCSDSSFREQPAVKSSRSSLAALASANQQPPLPRPPHPSDLATIRPIPSPHPLTPLHSTASCSTRRHPSPKSTLPTLCLSQSLGVRAPCYPSARQPTKRAPVCNPLVTQPAPATSGQTRLHLPARPQTCEPGSAAVKAAPCLARARSWAEAVERRSRPSFGAGEVALGGNAATFTYVPPWRRRALATKCAKVEHGRQPGIVQLRVYCPDPQTPVPLLSHVLRDPLLRVRHPRNTRHPPRNRTPEMHACVYV